MTNSETHRQFYLAAAGIRMWYAKRPLPGAAPSPGYQFDDDELQDSPALHNDTEVAPTLDVRAKELNSEQKAPPARPKSMDLQGLMASQVDTQEPAVEKTAPASISTQVDASVRPGARPVISAHLGLWATERFLLISQWSDEASERLQDALARNLLKALRQSDIAERSVLNWPVFRNPNIPGNAPDDFQQVLSHLLSPYQERSIILMGVLNAEQEDQREHCLKPALPFVGVDFPYSLAELSAVPAHKRDLWNALKSRYSL